jgi:hypothetical protein
MITSNIKRTRIDPVEVNAPPATAPIVYDLPSHRDIDCTLADIVYAICARVLGLWSSAEKMGF